MSHQHHSNIKILGIAFFLTTGYMIIEFGGGFFTNSLALISDAGHMLSDSVSLGISLVAIIVGQRKANHEKTYGYKRLEILAAFINGATLIGISCYILLEAFKRFSNPPTVASETMLTISIIGLIVNMTSAFILMRGDREQNLNLRSAYLHVIGDLLGSVGAIVAALLMIYFDLAIADPIASILVAILVLISGWRVFKETVHILLEGTPYHLSFDDVKTSLESVEYVKEVHDLHIWSLTNDTPLLTCHIVVMDEKQAQLVLQHVYTILKEKFNITHCTIQIEQDGITYDKHEH
ncbi:MAG: cation diffusion facilitator family transporter [Bacillaceae bacterium]